MTSKKRHNTNAEICKKAVDHELIPVEIPQNPMVGQQRQQISELQFDKFPTPHSFFMLEDKIQESNDYLL